MRPVFFLKEALRSLRRNAAPSFAAMATIVVTTLVLGVFIPVVQATTGTATKVREKVQVNVYLKPGAKDADVERVRRLLAEDTPYVGKVAFVSKTQALREQRERYPDAYKVLGGANPLPDTFRVTPKDPDDASKLRSALEPAAASGGRAPVDPAIDEVRFRRHETSQLLTVTRFVKITAGTLALLLGTASLLLIANTIRLSLYARRREVEVMKLVGATDWFIRWPFVLEGMLVGALGAVLAVLILLVGKIAVLDPVRSSVPLLAFPDTMGFGVLVSILMAAAIAVAAAGSGLSLRRYLRV